ncbi:hypothetical protein BC828DRAFT_67671 [Blastocladiella britannica]|nr:hypothetical protein BC828DRAFT_67671 [Blastocladiella britannica]
MQLPITVIDCNCGFAAMHIVLPRVRKTRRASLPTHTSLSWSAAHPQCTLSNLLAFSPVMSRVTWSGLPVQVYSGITALNWFTCRVNVSIDSLLPLDPKVLIPLLHSNSVNTAEWLLQLHLAADHKFVLPDYDALYEIYDWTQDSKWWVYDVTVTRKIPIFIKGLSDLRQYTEPRPYHLNY